MTLSVHDMMTSRGASQPLLGGGGGICSRDPLIFLDYIPCSPLINPIVPKNVLSSCSLDPENFCVVPLVPEMFIIVPQICLLVLPLYS